MHEDQALTSATDISKVRDDANALLYSAITHIQNTKVLMKPNDNIDWEMYDSIWKSVDAAQVQIESAMTLVSQIERRENQS